DDGDLESPFHNPKPKGGVFGFGGGYNWQYGAWVAGVEVDYGFSNEKETQSANIPVKCTEPGAVLAAAPAPVCTRSDSVHSKIDAPRSARLPLGYLFTPNLLAFGTAGLGWGRSELSFSETDCIGTKCNTESIIAKPNLFGWVAGGGLEYKLFHHVRIRGEYL